MIKMLYFSGNEWGNMGRRKPRLAYEFARMPEVASVLYVEPPVATSVLDLIRGRLGSGYLPPSRRAHLRALLGRVRQTVGKVSIYTGSTKTVPLTRFRAVRRMDGLRRLNERLYFGGIRRALRRLPGEELIVWVSHPLHAGALDGFPERALACYDWTDDWAAFDVLPVKDPAELIGWNDAILSTVDLVFAVSAELEQRATRVALRAVRAPNATDPQKLSAAAIEGPLAPELEGLPRPIVGYVGQVADKIDYELIGRLARARPGWSFVFVGPVWFNKQEVTAELDALANVHFLGFRPFDRLASYLRGFDVCTLPHVVSPLTQSMDPIKLYDYLATGKPIVSTPVAGVERFADVVHVAPTAMTFVTALESALEEDGRLAQRRHGYAQANTWPARADEIWQVLRASLAGGEVKN